MATLKVVVSSSRRYFCAGRCWEAGETEAVLEDQPGLSLEQQLAQLDAAKGGQQQDALGLERGNEAFYKAPPVLSYRIVLDEPPARSMDELHRTLVEALKPDLPPGPALDLVNDFLAKDDASRPQDPPPQPTSQTQPPAPGEATATAPPKEPAT